MKMSCNVRSSFVLLCLGLLFAWPSFAVEPVGKVTETIPRSWTKRGNGEVFLELEAPVYVEDLLITDESGQLEITFQDGTLVALGPLSEASVRDFVVSDVKNSFHAELFKGAVRIVTGEVVKRNPGGVKINTPRSTIGIRGTTVLCVFRGGDEIISVESLGDEALVGAHVTIIDRGNGNSERINEAGLSYVRRRGEATGNIERLEPGKRAAVNALMEFTQPARVAEPTKQEFDSLVDTVLRKVGEEENQGIKQENDAGGQKTNPRREFFDAGREGEDTDVDRPNNRNQRPNQRRDRLESPSPRSSEICD